MSVVQHQAQRAMFGQELARSRRSPMAGFRPAAQSVHIRRCSATSSALKKLHQICWTCADAHLQRIVSHI